MVRDAGRLPAWVIWQRRPFPDANLLLLRGRQPALVDSGFSPRGGNSRVGTHARRARRAGRQHPLAFGPRRGTRCCKPRNETPDQRQKRTLLTLGVPGVIASRPAVLGWEWGRGRGGEWRGFLGLFDRMHAGGRICNLECRVDAGQDFLWGHDWLLQAGWQRYSTEVPQRTRTEVVAEGRRRTVTCGDGRGWTCCRQMACQRSGVRISLAPPRSEAEFELFEQQDTAGKYRNGGPVGRRMCVRIGMFRWRLLLVRQRISVTAPVLLGGHLGKFSFPGICDICRLVVTRAGASGQPDGDCCRVAGGHRAVAAGARAIQSWQPYRLIRVRCV